MTMPETTDLSGLPQMMAVLAVEDIEQASGFYEKLGFGQEMTISGPDGWLAFAWLTFGSSALLLGRWMSPTTLTSLGPNGFAVALAVSESP